MSNIITLFPRKVKARGLNKSVLPIENKVKEQFFTEDYENLKLLDNIKINLEKTNVRLLYPGCGCDILFPLLSVYFYPFLFHLKLNLYCLWC